MKQLTLVKSCRISFMPMTKYDNFFNYNDHDKLQICNNLIKQALSMNSWIQYSLPTSSKPFPFVALSNASQ